MTYVLKARLGQAITYTELGLITHPLGAWPQDCLLDRFSATRPREP